MKLNPVEIVIEMHTKRIYKLSRTKKTKKTLFQDNRLPLNIPHREKLLWLWNVHKQNVKKSHSKK
mgnify:CR=1 FL=1